MSKILILIFTLLLSLNAYESEDKLKVIIVGKLAEYVECKEQSTKKEFVITVLKNPFNTLFDDVYKNKSIKSKPVKIQYIDTIDELKSTNILYIPNLNIEALSSIIEKTKNTNILTVSDSRGFASRGGVIQLYFVSQKLKLKINTKSAKEKGIKIKPTLLRITDVVKGDK